VAAKRTPRTRHPDYRDLTENNNMKPFDCAVALGVAVIGLATAPTASAVTLGSQDTFEDGTTEGWRSGLAHPVPPAVVADGGPSGSGDGYLQIVSLGGAGGGSRLVAIAGPQWTGDYLTAGVAGMSADVNNFGGTDVILRLHLAGPGGEAFSRETIELPSGSGWTRVLFSTTPDALSGATPGAASAVLANVTEVRLVHNPGVVFPGPAIAATIGIDNIAAVPEPGTWATLALGLGGIGALLARRRTTTI